MVLSRKHRRLICIDRYLRWGRTEGYIYVFQTESRKFPTFGTYHWDVSDNRHIEATGMMLNDLRKIASKRLLVGK